MTVYGLGKREDVRTAVFADFGSGSAAADLESAVGSQSAASTSITSGLVCANTCTVVRENGLICEVGYANQTDTT